MCLLEKKTPEKKNHFQVAYKQLDFLTRYFYRIFLQDNAIGRSPTNRSNFLQDVSARYCPMHSTRTIDTNNSANQTSKGYLYLRILNKLGPNKNEKGK